MEFAVVGISYKEADLELREKVSLTDTGKMELFQKMEEKGITQSVILCTCNRSEIYFLYEEENQKLFVQELYEEYLPDAAAKACVSLKEKGAAVEYLYQVAAGLESLVLGEDQILGQVLEAVEFSRQMGYSKKEMNTIFRGAITCAKKIKTELKISEHPLSVVYIGLKRLNQACSLKGKRVLVIGSGKMAALALTYLVDYQAEEIYLCSRSAEHTKRLQEKFPQMIACGYEERYKIASLCQAVISATAAPHIVLKKEAMKPPMGKQYLLDLAAPRDIDKELGNMPCFELYDMDSLKQTSEEGLRQREKLVTEGKKIIESHVQEIMEWLRISKMDLTIESLQNRCHDILEDTFGYLTQKIDLTEREKVILKKTLNASLQRLIREPIQNLKRLDSEEKQNMYRDVVSQLFQLNK